MKLNKSPSMPFYGKDIYNDEKALRLSYGGQGLYIRLLWLQWSEGSIPDDIEVLVGMLPREKELRKLWPEVRPLFSVELSPGRVIHPKLEKVRGELAAFRQRKVDAGRKGGFATSKTIAETQHCYSNAANVLVAKQQPAFASASPSAENQQQPSVVVRKQSKTQIDVDFFPTEETSSRCETDFPGVDWRAEVQPFIDHHRAKGNAFKDHELAFRNWIRNAAKFAAAKQARPESKRDQSMSLAQFTFMASRIAKWREESSGLYIGGTRSADAFQREFSMTWEQWEELQKQHSDRRTA